MQIFAPDGDYNLNEENYLFVVFRTAVRICVSSLGLLHPSLVIGRFKFSGKRIKG
jgi:hypothetical protein